MPVVQKKDAQSLLFNTIKSIMKLEKEEQTDSVKSRLKELKSFEEKLRKFMGNDMRQTPTAKELQRYNGIPEGAQGDLSKYTFPEEPETPVEKAAEDAGPSPEQPIKPVQEPSKPKEAEAKPDLSVIQKVSKTAPATLARPKVVDPKKEQLPLEEIQNWRRRLQRAKLANAQLSQGKQGAELDKMQEERDNKIDPAYNAAVSLERQRYEETPSLQKPNDWDVVAPKDLPMSVLQKYDTISDWNKLPDELRFAEQRKKTFAKEPGEVPGGKGKGQRFINNEIRRSVNNLSSYQKEIDKLDPLVEADKRSIDKYEKKVDEAKDRIRYLQKSKPLGLEDKTLSDEWNNLSEQIKGYLTPEQREAYQQGKEVDIAKIPNQQAFLRSLRELGRERDKINQSVQDEMSYLQADPYNTIQDFRGLPVNERKEVLQDIKRDSFMRKIASGVEDYYNINRPKKARDENINWDQVEPDEQQRWVKKFAASEARKGAPGMSGNDIYKFLFGGGEQFYSKYPAELQRPMISAARSGLSGLEQANRRISSLASQDPYQLLYGESAPTMRNFITGAGQAPQVPQVQLELPEPQPGNLFGNPQPTFGQTLTESPQSTLALQRLLQSMQPQQPNQQPLGSGQVDQLIASKLANLLQGAQ